MLRKTKDGRIVSWNVEADDCLCTLKEAFEKIEPSLGFNIELKFDDNIVYTQEYLVHVLQAILEVSETFCQIPSGHDTMMMIIHYRSLTSGGGTGCV